MVLPIILVDKKDMSDILEIIKKDIFEMKFCLFIFEFTIEDLNDYIDNMHYLNLS